MKKISISIQLDTDTVTLLDAMADTLQLSRSSYIRMLILDAIKEKGLCTDTSIKDKIS